MKRTHLLLSSLIIIGILITFSWFLNFKQLATGEEGISIFNDRQIIKQVSIWQDNGTGFLVPHYLTRLLPAIFSKALSSLLPYVLVQAFLFFFILTFGLVGVYLLSRFLFSSGKDSRFTSFNASLFYFFNLYSMTQVWSRFLYSGITAWALLPFAILFWIRWIEKNRFVFLFLTVLALSLFSSTFLQPANIFTIWVPLLFISIFYGLNSKKIAKVLLFSFFGFLFWGISNIWWIYPNLKLTKIAFSKVLDLKANFDSLRGISAGIKFWDILTLWHGLFLGKEGPWGWFYQNPLVLNFLRFVPLALAVVGILKSKKEKYFPFLLTLFLVGWFVSKGTNPPLGYPFFKFLFFNFPFTAVLRNSWEKFGLVFVLPYSIFFALGVNSIYQRLKPKVRELAVGGILFLSCGILVWPMWTGDVYTKDVHVQVPSFYEEANHFINSFGSRGRILMLPMIAGDGVKMSWGYGGIEPSEFLFDRPVISRILRTKYFDDVYWGLRDRLNKAKRIDSLDLKNLDVTFLILRRDLVHWLDKNDLDVDEIREIVLANKDIRHLKDFGDLEIYLFEPNKNGSLFEVLDGNGVKISYQKFSPTRYKLEVKDSTKPFTLVFKNTYNDFWIARINKEEIKNHFLIYNYANAWRIEKKGDYTIDIVFKVWPWE